MPDRFALCAFLPSIAAMFVSAVAAAPVMRENIDRPLRYMPDGTDFVISNGREFFNRPLYGSNSPFRVDGGDKPEFSLYLRGRGGNLRLAISTPRGAKWLHDADQIEARYRPGSMIYRVRDSLLGRGSIELTAIPFHQTEGLIVRAAARDVEDSIELIGAFGGSTGARGARDGDIGTEREPVAAYFQLKPEYCQNNVVKVDGAKFWLTSRAATIVGLWPPQSKISIAPAEKWNALNQLLAISEPDSPRPIVVSRTPLHADAETFVALQRVVSRATELPPTTQTTRPATQPALVPEYDAADLPRLFDEAEAHRQRIATRIEVDTPDPFINAAAAALCVAADATWDDRENAVMHGAVAWRNKLLGWRGMYWFDALGQHELLRKHLNNWLPKQNIDPIPPQIPAPEASANLSRNETALHSNGAMSFGHYDMNLVAIDALFRHILWTGDLEYAREVWPAIERHLAWERRLFRRPFDNEGGADEPLYEAYACIWASDDVGYNGGGATHATAYNYFHNIMAARVAEELRADPSSYRKEAELIRAAMKKHLWLADRGWFAEWKDLLGLQLVHENAALWTFYHTIDSRVPDPFEAWQMSRFVDTQLAHIPVRGQDVPAGKWFTLPTTSWMPHAWSTNNVVTAEAAHGALAMFQIGRGDEANKLLKGLLLDSMFMGLCPGNVGMCTPLDMLRGERQRDFADGCGSLSRTLVEGLFGVAPDALAGDLTIRPGFPADWDRARLNHPSVSIDYRRDGDVETFVIEQKFSRPMRLLLQIPGRRDSIAQIIAADDAAGFQCIEPSIGQPRVQIVVQPAPRQEIRIEWTGKPVAGNVAPAVVDRGDTFGASFDTTVEEVRDPQNALERPTIDDRRVTARAIGADGHRTLFVKVQQGQMSWWSPVHFQIRCQVTSPPAMDWNQFIQRSRIECVNLTPHLNDRITQIFKNEYLSPRSPYCSLAVPKHGYSTWCKPAETFEIDDTGLRETAAKKGGEIELPNGLRFQTPGDRDAKNVLFTSRWTDYPAEVTVPLSGNASRVFLLMAGSTTPMLSQFDNAEVIVTYADDTTETLKLHNPTTWWPIDQDYCIDDFAFARPDPLPPRINLKTGEVRILDMKSFKGRGAKVPGGAATVLDLLLDGRKELKSLKVRVLANEIVVGLMGVTLLRG